MTAKQVYKSNIENMRVNSHCHEVIPHRQQRRTRKRTRKREVMDCSSMIIEDRPQTCLCSSSFSLQKHSLHADRSLQQRQDVQDQEQGRLSHNYTTTSFKNYIVDIRLFSIGYHYRSAKEEKNIQNWKGETVDTTLRRTRAGFFRITSFLAMIVTFVIPSISLPIVEASTVSEAYKYGNEETMLQSSRRRSLQTTQQCRLSMAIRDAGRDDLLFGVEYIAFLNQLFRNRYSTVTTLEELPCPLQAVFQDNQEEEGAINVQGTKPGQTATAEQDARIDAICAEVLTIADSNPPLASGSCDDDNAGGGGDDDPPAQSPNGNTGSDVDCTGTIQRPQCNTALAVADLTRDNRLDTSEFMRFVNRLSGSAYAGLSFNDLPGNLQAVYTKFASAANGGVNNQIDVNGSKPGQIPTTAQDTRIDALCCETDFAVANPGSPVAAPTLAPGDGGGGGSIDCTGTIPQTQCNTALAFADLNRNDLMNESEYLRFINRLSGNEYSGVNFSALPGGLQSNFRKFATNNGQVSISGSKPGQSPSAEQATFLAALCCETDLTVDDPNIGVGGGGGGGEPSPSPPTESFPPTYQPQICRTAMASSDFDRNDFLNEIEYVRFLNRLTQNQFQGVTFASLDQALQDNYQDKVDANGQISIFGSKPGQSPNAAQAGFLDELCVDTAIVLQDDASPSTEIPSPPDTPTIAPAPDGPPTFPDNLCRTAMASSDFNRDDYLNEIEFVRFLNRLTQNEFIGDTFETLEIPLPQTFTNLADETDEIWIFGSKPGQDAAQVQEDFLLTICFQISIALNQLGSPLTPNAPPSQGPPNPTQAPVTPGPTLPPGIAEVYNSFIISNTRGSDANALQSGINREGLNNAYGTFIASAVQNIASTARRLALDQQLRGRRLAVSFANGSDEIYLLTNSQCPEGSSESETCLTAFAKFRLNIDDEDPTAVSSLYSEATQQLISDGELQEVLLEVDPRNSLRVVDASLPLLAPPTPSPTPAPVVPPTDNNGGNNNGGSGGSKDNNDGGGGGGGGSALGAIMGGVIGGIVVCAGIGWVSTKLQKRKKQKQIDDDDEKGDDGSDIDKDEGFGGFGSNDDTFGEKPEQISGDKKGFGFGKKNKDKEEDVNEFGADTNSTNNNNFGDDNDNLELFAFDEPSVVKGNEDPDGASASESNTFGAGEAGWGNSNENGGFFGNENGWDATNEEKGSADNFFAASTFGENVEESRSDSRSRSPSDDEDSYSSSDKSYNSGSQSASGSNFDDDGSYEDEFDDGDASGSYSRSSAEGSSYNSSSPSQRDSGTVEDDASRSYSGSSADHSNRSSFRDNADMSQRSGDDVDGEGDEEGSFSGSESESGSLSNSASSETTATTTEEERERRDAYLAQVDALVKLVLPDEAEKVDAMMKQFKGRENELVSTLQTMQERSATQRARAAVHKSKNRPERGDEAGFGLGSGIAGGAEGSVAGTAAIAAASLPLPAEGMFEEGSQENGFGDDGDKSYDDEEGSYYSGEGSYSGSGSRSGSYSGSGSRSGSYSGSRSYYDEGSYRSGEGSYVSGEGSYQSGDGSGSYRSGSRGSGSYSGSRSRSSYSGSQRSGSGSRSYYSGSQQSGSYRSGEGSQSQRSGSQSYYSGDEGGSRSQRSGSQSYYSEEGSRSQYSGSQPYSDEGSRSQSQSQSQYSQSQEGSRSYYSGEEEGSYYSKEGSGGSFAD